MDWKDVVSYYLAFDVLDEAKRVDAKLTEGRLPFEHDDQTVLEIYKNRMNYAFNKYPVAVFSRLFTLPKKIE